MMELVGGRELWLSILRRGHITTYTMQIATATMDPWQIARPIPAICAQMSSPLAVCCFAQILRYISKFLYLGLDYSKFLILNIASWNP
jgi:hypothetical protein